MNRISWRKFVSPAILILSAAVAVAPIALRGPTCGHDFDFHLASWLDALHSWRYGVVYPHWAPSPNFGAGEPRFVFYPPLTWMVGAALGTMMRWTNVSFVLPFLILAATGFATRALARQAMGEGAATLAGCLAIFSGYALFTTYERSALAELTGGFWIPWMLLLILRSRERLENPRPPLWRSAWDGSAWLLALVIAGAWLSNAPLGVMACYLLAGVALAVAVLSRSWAPILRAATGVTLGLGLAAVYILPAAWEQRWIDVKQAIDDPGSLVQNSFLFARHASPQLELHDIELFKVSLIALSMITVTIAGILVSWVRHTLPGPKRWWIPLAITTGVILLLQLPFSLPIWKALPKLQFLQFPWRWLVVLEAPMGIFVASALWQRTRRGKITVSGFFLAFFILMSAVGGLFLYQECDAEDSVMGMLAAVPNTGVEGTDEYAPIGADNSIVATNLPGACLVADPSKPLGAGDPDLTPHWTPEQNSCDATYALDGANWKGNPEHRKMDMLLPHAGFLVLRLRTYPAWRVQVNGRPVSGFPQRDDGLMAVPVPVGPVKLQIDWTTTSDVRTARWISLLALGLVTALGVLERRWKRAHL